MLPANDTTGLVRVKVFAFDDNMLPAGDGERVQFESHGGEVLPAETELVDGECIVHCQVPAESEQCEIVARLGDISARAAIVRDEGAQPMVYGRVRDTGTDEPVAGALVVTVQGKVDTTDASGYFIVQGTGGFRVSAPGYVPETVSPVTGDSCATVELRPVADRRLHGLRIAIDPQYGGDWHGFISPTGVRAADINLRVAELLNSYLVAAGAECVIVRTGNSTVPVLSRVSITNEFEANLYFEISHGASPEEEVAVLDESGHLITEDLADLPYVAAYPTSPEGNRLAKILVRHIEPLVTPAEVRIVGSSSTTLAHTACPAVCVHVGEPRDQDAVRLLTDTVFMRRQAYAFFTAIQEWAGVRERDCGSIQGRVTRGGDPVRGCLVTLDEWLSLQTDELGMYHFRLVTPGSHVVSISGDDGKEIVRKLRAKARQRTAADFSLPSREVEHE